MQLLQVLIGVVYAIRLRLFHKLVRRCLYMFSIVFLRFQGRDAFQGRRKFRMLKGLPLKIVMVAVHRKGVFALDEEKIGLRNLHFMNLLDFPISLYR